MNLRGHLLSPTPRRIALFLSVVIFAAAPVAICQTQNPSPDSSSALAEGQHAYPKPIPVGWKIAIVAIVAMGGGFAVAFSLRAWRSSNLFDRQYRFPAGKTAALRLGANKSGGCMATIEFGHRAK